MASTYVPIMKNTVNSAIVTPSGQNAATAPLPATALDGKIDVFALNGFFTSKLTDDFRLNARYRYYQNENNTPRVRFEEGYVRFDAVWEDIPRITVPYGWNSGYFQFRGCDIAEGQEVEVDAHEFLMAAGLDPGSILLRTEPYGAGGSP